MMPYNVEQKCCTVMPVGFWFASTAFTILTNFTTRDTNSDTVPATCMSLPPMPSKGTTLPGPMRSTSPGMAMPIMRRLRAASHVPMSLVAVMFQCSERSCAFKPYRMARSSAHVAIRVSASSSKSKARRTAGRCATSSTSVGEQRLVSKCSTAMNASISGSRLDALLPSTLIGSDGSLLPVEACGAKTALIMGAAASMSAHKIAKSRSCKSALLFNSCRNASRNASTWRARP